MSEDDGSTHPSNQRFQALRIINVALMLGVAIFAAVVVFLIPNGAAEGEFPLPKSFLLGIGFVTFFGASYVERSLKSRTAPSLEEALENFQMAAIVPQALRESVGLLGVMAGFLTADLTLTIGFAAASIATIALAMPKRGDFEAIAGKFDAETR